jgi:molybdopterin converting factor small subunit
MKLTLNYFGQLRQAAGLTTESLEQPDSISLEQLLVNRADGFGEEFKKILLDQNSQPRPSVLVIINNVTADRQSPPVLQDGDEITLMPAIAGG